MDTENTTLVVTGKSLIAEDLVELRLRHPRGERLPDWTPGSHIDLILADGRTRQYSLCSNPWQTDEYRIAIRREVAGRGGSAYIHDSLVVGETVNFGGPRNNFALVPSPRYAFIAGGIGITPILPMIRQVQQMGSPWRLLYLGRSRASTGFLDVLEGNAGSVTTHFDDEQGMPDLASWIGDADPDLKLYACGPAGMLAAVERLCSEWRPGWVRIEKFMADLSSPARDTPFEVELARTGRVVTVTPGVAITTALREAGVNILTSCGAGLCGTCETGVLGGTPDHRDSVLNEDERRSDTCLIPCVSRALDDRLVLDL